MNIGPRNITYGLVFGYDVGSDFSYYGEPTTNLVPDASNNGRFTTSNSWATYNTNKYCGNNGCAVHWTIPSISSVSNNIITTSSAHQILSFDVIQPNATGGGVNAGQNYVAKKISDTQFSLHEYNGSQDGSQGYINPSTGFYKVHDAYATDTRVSVSASGFPTGWWGSPHLPNSGLIKEIVPGGGRVSGTNCMRWHVYRGDGIADGMAYGVYTPVTAGDTITVSYYLRAATRNAANKGGSYTTYFYGNGAFGAGFSCGAYGEWVRNVHQWTASSSVSFYQYWFPEGSGDRYSMDMADLQVEVNRGHVTKFTTGTRSTTASLKDMSSNNSTLNVSDLSFNSSGVITFDGTNDYLDTTKTASQLGIYDGKYTMECIVYFNSVSSDQMVFGTNQTAVRQGMHIGCRNGSIYQGHYSADFGAGSISANTYYHLVWTYDNTTSTATIYKNGVSQGSGSISSFIGTTNIWIGRHWGYCNAYIPVTKIYNRALSASEISQHYYSYKTRFGLS